MPKWTLQQNNAITARNRNVLVSAAAGSGKTAVLVERVKQLITDKDAPVSIENLLIVTFTNAAAAEMKYRISKALNDLIRQYPRDNFYRQQLSSLPNAKICTIDSFCTNLVREHFYDLEISQDFSIFDESELQLLQDTVINEILDKRFENSTPEFISLIETFTTPNNDKPVISAIKKVLRFIYAQPFPYNWLDSVVEKYNPDKEFSDTIWYKYIHTQLDKLFNLGISLVEENIKLTDFEDIKLNEKFLRVFEDDLSEFNRFKNAFEKSWDDAVNQRAPAFMRMPSSSKIDKSISSKLKANRDIYKKLLMCDIQSFLTDSKESYYEDVKGLYDCLKAFKELIKEVDERLLAEKKERNSFSFSDIEHFAITLLFKMEDNGQVIRTRLAEDLSKSFYEILVDEYQDTNEAQDLLFTYLSNGRNLFSVGDIKQSIYRFRLAMPHIFNERKKRYSLYNADENQTFAKIILDKNFRSRKEICSYVNFIFSNLMSEELGELDYTEEEYLNYGASYEENTSQSAKICILQGVKGEDADKKEAAYIAHTIIDKVNSGELIKDGDNYRPIRYGDFAILMRSLKNHINEYSEILTDFGIPVICDNSTNLFENNEIRMIMSMLRTIDNPRQDIPLLATMMSPFYAFTPDELSKIRLDNKGGNLYYSVFKSDNPKVLDFINDQRELRRISVTMPVASFIRYIVEDKGLISYINAMGNAEQRYQNILKLISFAHNFDNGINVGLTAFLRYIDKIIESDKSLDSASLSSTGNDAVTIMSVHHSKGLEFPICIFAGTNRQYNKSDLNDKLLLNPDFGLGIKCHNEEHMYQYKSIPYSVIKDKNTTELMSENLRVLYVALTRAKEQFITFITCDNLENKMKRLSSYIINNRVSPYLLKKINCDADLFLICCLLHKDGKELRELAGNTVQLNKTDFELQVEIKDDIEISDINTDIVYKEPDPKIIDEISKKLSFHYERKELENISSKLTASSLDDMGNNYEFITSSKPSFLYKNGLNAAQRGTAMHTFMQYCIYDEAKKNLNNEIVRLVNCGFMSQIQADSLDKEKINNFFKGELAQRIFSADNIYREIKVSSFVPANKVYDVNFDDPIIIQGIADCVFEENGKLILVDYKTDQVKHEEELLERYQKQIMFYKSAVEKTLNKPVKAAVLYSFELGKACYFK